MSLHRKSLLRLNQLSSTILLIASTIFYSDAVVAGNHLLRINEVLAGLNGDSSIQFVELVTADDGEKLWGPNGAAVGRVMLVFFNNTGIRTGRYVFPSNPAEGNNTVLIATQAFADFSGMTPDFIMPTLVIPVAGKVCFTNNPEIINANVNLCLSYGGSAYSGDTEGGGTANSAALSILGSSSLSRFQNFTAGNDDNSSFALAAPTPASTTSNGIAVEFENNSTGEINLPAADTQVNQGNTLFNMETFLGNGRTCASCHLPDKNFGLPPDSIAALPLTDPLFINELNINTLVVNSTGSVNPGASAEASQPGDFFAGRTISGSLGGSAVVLAGTGNTYLIIGGNGLNIAGNVISDTQGNTGSLVLFTTGNLNGPAPNGDSRGLEDSSLLRGGRALITENINGFSEQAFMRGSPTLLNIKFTAPYGLSEGFSDLQSFSAGAVKQHFTRNLNRIDGTDFRTPTTAELNAMAAFMDTIVLPADGNFDDSNNFARFVSTGAQKRGRELFFGAARCSVCHAGPVLATSDGQFNTLTGVNENFLTGVPNLLINSDDDLPTEQDIGGQANIRAFSTPGLFGIKNTGPFFHDNSVSTLLEAIKFYREPEFESSGGSNRVGDITALDDDNNVNDIEAFLNSLVDIPFTFTRTLDLGNQVISAGETSPRTVIITNTGQSALTITNVSTKGTNPLDFLASIVSPDTGPFGSGQSRTINISFDPENIGLKMATLEFEISDGTETFSVGVAVSGSGGLDSDGDGVFDTEDAFPFDPIESIDTDNDGIGNNADTDDDNDGISDEAEIAVGRNPIINEAAVIIIINSILDN